MTVVDRLRAEIAAWRDDSPFEELALAAYAYQHEHVPALARLAAREGKSPANVNSWRDVPLVPAQAFATVELSTDPPRETFRSSGTLGGERSVHRHPFPELYRAVIDATFRPACLPRGGRPPVLSLVPPREVAPDSSLGFLVDHVVTHHGGSGSAYGFGERGVEIGACRSWLAGRQREGTPVLVLATAFALADLVERLERMNLHFRLPPGSALVETGGFKGRTREIPRDELLAKTATWIGIPSETVVSEYGMTELTSHAYTRILSGGEPGLFVPPPWLKVRALDPVTLAELPDGATGLLAFFDLANVGSALHVLTEDLGSTTPAGFRLAGRAPEADLRGCSLLAEELGRGATPA